MTVGNLPHYSLFATGLATLAAVEMLLRQRYSLACLKHTLLIPISKIWDYMLCLRSSLLDCKNQLGWIASQTGIARRVWLKDQQGKEEQKFINHRTERKGRAEDKVTWINKSSVGALVPQKHLLETESELCCSVSLVVNDYISAQYQERHSREHNSELEFIFLKFGQF